TAVAMGLGTLGVFAAGLVAFPVPEVDAVAWLFAGVVLAVPTRVPARGRGRRSIPAVAVVATLATAVATWAGTTDVLADRDMGDAITAASSDRTAVAVASAERAVARRGE